MWFLAVFGDGGRGGQGGGEEGAVGGRRGRSFRGASIFLFQFHAGGFCLRAALVHCLINVAFVISWMVSGWFLGKFFSWGLDCGFGQSRNVDDHRHIEPHRR